MSPAQPEGERWSPDGSLDPGLVEADRGRPLSLYVHVPFCRVRCGYCDFNTYTVGFGPGAQVGDYAPSVLAEASLAARVMSEAGLPAREARTVFFGGGTPTMLDTTELVEILTGLRERIGIAPGAEVTLEANPDTVTRDGLAQLGVESELAPAQLLYQNAVGVGLAAEHGTPVSAQELAPVYLRISQAERERNPRLQQESTQK